MNKQLEMDEADLERRLASGEIGLSEYNKALRELHRDYRNEARGAAEDAAERAYRDELERW